VRLYPWHPHPKLSATENVYGKENSPRQPSAATPLKEGGFIQRTNFTFSAARHREVLQELFSKSGFFAKLFYIKKRTYLHKQKPHSKYTVGLFLHKKSDITPHTT